MTKQPNGAQHLTLAESQKLHPRIKVTKKDLDDPTKAYLRYPQCPDCGRYIAKMDQHKRKYHSGSRAKAKTRKAAKRTAKAKETAAA